MTQEALKKMYQLLLTEPHAPTVCAKLEAIAREALAQPEQEPVIDKSAAIRIATALGWTPPRTWVGLTDEEVIVMSRYDLEYAALIGEVQRKIKEKNT